MNLYCPHIQIAGSGLDLLERWKPSSALAMDVDSNYVRKVREKSPNTILVVRVYEDGANFLEWSPVDWVNRLLARFPNERPNFFVTVNEPFGHDSTELFERFDIWESEVIRLLQAQGTDGLACNFGTGNFTAGANRVRIPDVFPRICEIANTMGPHDYDWPDLQSGWSWYAGRWFQWHDDILAATGKKMRFLIGECGLTQAVIAGRPDHGWQSGGPEGVTAESYLATLKWYLEQVITWDAGRGIVLGLCIFNWYDQFHGSFEHINRPEVVDAIIAMDVPVPEPPEPNGGETVTIRVLNIDNVELFGEAAADLIAYHGITIHEPVDMREDEWYWAIVLMDEREGPAATIYTGLLADGSPAVGQEAAWAWTDNMGESDEILGANYPTDWQKQADLGYLNENGNMGPGFGQHGWDHAPYEPGPGRAWIRDPIRWAVLATGIGWLGMTNHRTMYPTWRLKQWQGEEPPIPPVPPVEDNEALWAIEARLSEIRDVLAGDGYTPPEPPVPPEELFTIHFFNNMELSGPSVYEMKVKPPLVFNWGLGSPEAGVVNADNISARCIGTFTFAAGAHRFRLRTDDGVRMRVDGSLVLDQWVPRAPTIDFVDIVLSEGKHEVLVEWFERTGGAVLEVSW